MGGAVLLRMAVVPRRNLIKNRRMKRDFENGLIKGCFYVSGCVMFMSWINGNLRWVPVLEGSAGKWGYGIGLRGRLGRDYWNGDEMKVNMFFAGLRWKGIIRI
jgi:hypothetical protein